MGVLSDIHQAAAVKDALEVNTAVLNELLKVLKKVNSSLEALSLNIQRLNNKM